MCVAIEAVILAGVYFAGIEQGRQAAFNEPSAFNAQQPQQPNPTASTPAALTPLMQKPSNGIGVGP